MRDIFARGDVEKLKALAELVGHAMLGDASMKRPAMHAACSGLPG